MTSFHCNYNAHWTYNPYNPILQHKAKSADVGFISSKNRLVRKHVIETQKCKCNFCKLFYTNMHDYALE